MRRRTISIVLVLVLAISAGTVIWEYESGQVNYSYSFRVAIGYLGQWSITYYGCHRVGATSNCNATDNYTGGIYTGTGNSARNITLSGPSNYGLALCVQAQKLDSSTSNLTISIDAESSSTSLPFGEASMCQGVVP
jgi:hypothetical protein